MTEDGGAGEGTIASELYCEQCKRQFKSSEALGGHMRWHDRSKAESKKAAPPAWHILCPVCKTDTHYRSDSQHLGDTTCDNCLTMFSLFTLDVVYPPPLGCVWETLADVCQFKATPYSKVLPSVRWMAGRACRHAEHKYWAKKYAAEHVGGIKVVAEF